MSAGGWVVDRDMDKLAPRFRLAVEQAVADCRAADLDVMVWEAYRSNELQAVYYARGRPPTKDYPRPVTNAKTNLFSWHGYGLAVDVISEKEYWTPREDWWAEVAEHFKAHGCDWGGDWRKPDLPHFQFGSLRPSPSHRARELIAQDGMQAVWDVVGAT